MVASLSVATAASGALAGFVAGVAALPLSAAVREPGRSALAVAALAAAVLADLAGRRAPGTGRQVPREWGRIFPPAGAAALYGARLGVGPLTLGSSWLWWATALGAALLGPWTSVAAGLTFGVVRAATTTLAGMRISRNAGTISA